MDTHHSHLLSIGAFADVSRLSLKALRLYDRLRLLPPAYVDSSSGYRYYRTDQLRQAKMIRLMRDMEMPLAKIRSVLAVTPQEAEDMVEFYTVSIETRVERIRRNCCDLLDLLKQEERDMSFEVKSVQLPTQQVVSITRSVKIDGLHAHIVGSKETLYRLVEAQGGTVSGAPYGIFHGPVNSEDGGLMEVCLPAEGRFAVAGDVVVKEMAGGTFASLTLRGEETDFPAILGAYDAVREWVQKQGYDPVCAPREIWHVGPPEPVMEIAWAYGPR